MSDLSEKLTLAGHKIQILKRDVEFLQKHKNLSSGSSTLAKVLKRILSVYFAQLQAVSTQAGNNTDRLREVIYIHNSAMYFVPRIIQTIITAEDSPRMDGVVESYAWICDQAQAGSRLIMYGAWENNASYWEVMSYLEDLTDHFDPKTKHKIFEGVAPFVPIVSFPAAELKITLRQALVAHEIGHFIDESRRLADELLTHKLFPEESNRKLKKAMSDSPSRTNRLVRHFLNRAAGTWIREFVADYLAVSILGPAYVFAFEEFSFSASLQGGRPITLTTSHPPNELRLITISEICLQMYFYDRPRSGNKQEASTGSLFERLQLLVGAPMPIADKLKGIPEVSQDICQIAFRILSDTLKNAIDLLNEILRDLSEESWPCSSADLAHAVELSNYLEEGLPPSELRGLQGFPSFAAIMNAGWIYLIENSQDFNYFVPDANNEFPDPDAVSNKHLALQELVAIAVENINFQREYMERAG